MEVFISRVPKLTLGLEGSSPFISIDSTRQEIYILNVNLGACALSKPSGPPEDFLYALIFLRKGVIFYGPAATDARRVTTQRIGKPMAKRKLTRQQRRQMQRKGVAGQPHWSLFWLLLLLTAIALAMVWGTRRQDALQSAKAPEQAKGPVYMISYPDMMRLNDSLLAAVAPERPENSYMPPFMKQRISWLFSGIARKRIQFFPDTSAIINPPTMAITQFHGDTAALYLRVVRIAFWIWYQGHGTPGSYRFNQMQKNTFAVALVHETVHMENPAINRYTPQQHLQEEYRTWRKTDLLAVRPLLQMGQPLDSDFVDVDNVLRSCGDKVDCSAFKRALAGKTGFKR